MAVKTHHPSQMEFFAVPSPCIGVCQAGPKGYCLGCFRSREERLYWLKVDDATRRTIIKACHRRKRLAQGKNATRNDSETDSGFPQPDLFGNENDT